VNNPPRGRVVTVVLDEPRGALPTISIESPWWQEAEPVVAAIRERFGIEIVILRLLEGDVPSQSPVTYLAELVRGDPSPVLQPWHGVLREDPLRAAYAKAGGPKADLDWAARHVTFAGMPVQVRTWNLSSLWKIPTTDGLVWLKHVPSFFAHEPAMLRALGAAAPVPMMIAGEPGRMLLADVPGYDCYDAKLDQLEMMVDTLVDLQQGWTGRVEELLHLGAPDWRAPTFVLLAADVIERDAPAGLRRALGRFADRLPSLLAEIEACGVPDTFVHGDFHPGNVRWSGGRAVILDWGDAGAGHPLMDLPSFLERVGGHREQLRARWLRRWADAAPGSDPQRAAALIEPVAQLRLAIIYRKFLDGIEKTERVYHHDDVPERLRRVAEMSDAQRGS